MSANEREHAVEEMVVEFVGGPYDGIRINDLHVVPDGPGTDVGAEFTVLGDRYVVRAKPRPAGVEPFERQSQEGQESR